MADAAESSVLKTFKENAPSLTIVLAFLAFLQFNQGTQRDERVAREETQRDERVARDVLFTRTISDMTALHATTSNSRDVLFTAALKETSATNAEERAVARAAMERVDAATTANTVALNRYLDRQTNQKPPEN